MQPTTSGRFRVLDRRETSRAADGGAVFVLVEVHEEPVAPDDPEAVDAYDPIYVAADGYPADGDGANGADASAAAVESLSPGCVVDATIAWTDGVARFRDLEVVRESRLYVADGVEDMFTVATEAWREASAAGEAMTALTTRSTDGDPNGALYLFADAAGRDTLEELRDGTLPIEPLIARVNARREDDAPRAVFLLRPADAAFVAVYVVFDRDGVLARTVRDTYAAGDALAAIDADAGIDAPDDAFDLDDSLRNL